MDAHGQPEVGAGAADGPAAHSDGVYAADAEADDRPGLRGAGPDLPLVALTRLKHPGTYGNAQVVRRKWSPSRSADHRRVVLRAALAWCGEAETGTRLASPGRGDVDWEARVRAAHHRLARTPPYAEGSEYYSDARSEAPPGRWPRPRRWVRPPARTPHAPDGAGHPGRKGCAVRSVMTVVFSAAWAGCGMLNGKSNLCRAGGSVRCAERNGHW